MRLTLVGFVIVLNLSLISVTTIASNESNIDKKQAITLALAEYAGKTLKVSEENNFFVVRILQKDGRIVDLKVDKKTGKVKKD
ncbi:PepSY domain-containing protein [Pseudoalteromonas phenolica]|uniref:PepSY domain-containing protein n=1 Tax=Pseudoalteromonas phenolica TaxID=161398 RepID=A0A0S2K286_9GAMM|nr:PepSY domain-containing protein [Pseudoalteromonas phenolica]ALO42369.1 hypothetical protein PP2015_1868 [Pseudoalteromonas phenolica]MBE0356535.1 hypothetical protein [Pseudoalteromonas phenolica O-BC30]RXE97008.1 PepSY domain-containing protein [Pseudoalteromonas phenolica O-BC30]TMO54203.1 hypothetical protein CWC21_15945 [Pseudoalteromonas phenolica]